MAYIDTDKLLNAIPDGLPYKESVKRVILQAPKVDAVEVVRCKDCVFRVEMSGKEFIYRGSYPKFCIMHNRLCHEYNYCDYGERKKMSEKEYIERNALLAEYDRVHIGTPGGARKLIAEAPTADVAEVKHGYWIRGDRFANCSECGTAFEALPTMFAFEANNIFCRHCGAKMDGERKGGVQG